MRFSSAFLAPLSVIASTFVATVSANGPPTAIHEKGRCAMRGHCGKQGFFGKDLPCPDNGLAEEPSSDVRKKLVSICGDKWAEGPVCCAEEQIDSLSENLKRAETFIASCPACQSNFYNLFCTFTCSPDQSLFVNITDTVPKSGKTLVTELDNLFSDEYVSGFYDSCKDVKFGATNSRAMQFIGGGAKNGQDFVNFLGHKSALGSPFQINFPRPDENKFPGLEAVNDEAHPCNSTDTRYKCACMDCGSSCVKLPEVSSHEGCHVGHWPCLSFAVVLIYCIFVMMLILAITGHVYHRKRKQNRQDRLRLLQDTTIDDDEDEDFIYNPNTVWKPTRPYAPNSFFNRVFGQLGRMCARYPAITIGTSIVIIALLNLGWMRFAVETDPVRLWVAPDSDAAAQKAFFDDNFGPFFRAEQAFLVNDTHKSGPGPILDYDTLSWWFSVEDKVRSIKSADGKISFDDICYNPTGDGCVVQSVSGFYQAGLDRDDWDEQLQTCVDNPVEGTCLPDFGQPLDINLIVGPFNKSVFDTEALVITWVVRNYEEGTPGFERAEAWEQSLKEYLQDTQVEAKKRGLRLSFNTEISLQQELNKSTNTDAAIVVVSYLIMFLYASIALGSTTISYKTVLKDPKSILVQSKFMLGVVGIVIVLLSVSSSVGLFSACGIKVTLVIAEVIPFLVLAVGVDNIFLLVHEFERINAAEPHETIEWRTSATLARMGPSILLSATMETIAFALGTAVGMPAVKNFAAYAAGAVLINALLQVTMFVSVLALNQRRVEAGRVDCVPCIQIPQPQNTYYAHAPPTNHDEDAIQRFIRTVYAPALLGRKTKVAVFTIFFGLFAAGLALLPEVKLGLDQRIAIPEDSYLIDYFNDLYSYFNAGPPVYFVTKPLNVTERERQQELCGRFSTCDSLSLTNILEGERKRPEISYIASPAASWVDDFFLWLNPNLGEDCCVDPATGEPCFAHRDPAWNITLSGMPEGEEYMSYLQRWLAAPTTADCPLAGKAAYSDAVVVDNRTLTISASHFRTAHTPLRSQDDFIEAYAAARRISKSIEQSNPGVEVFPYSKFYIFFDQYSTIVRLTMALLGSALIACFLISSLLLGSIRTGAVITATVAMTLVDIGGAMSIAGVSLNAVTLVNLVICVGIAVEFCAHIARAFQFPSHRLITKAGSGITVTQLVINAKNVLGERQLFTIASHSETFFKRDARAWAALTQVGGSVFSGITVTKFLGVSVLAFTRSKIFEVYFFRVWLALVIFAALHALVFLPVALSVAGSQMGWAEMEAEGGLEDDLRRRRWDALGAYTDDWADENEVIPTIGN